MFEVGHRCIVLNRIALKDNKCQRRSIVQTMTILHDVRSQRSLVSISVLLTQAFYTIPACAGNFY